MGVRVFSHALLYLTDSYLLPAFKPDAEIMFDSEKIEWILNLPEKQQSLARTQIRAISNYTPRTFSGDISLFSTGPDSVAFPNDPTRGWNSCITGKTIVIESPGGHGTIFQEPFGQIVAKKIEESLKRVDVHG